MPASSMSAIAASGSAQPWIERRPAGATVAAQPASPWAFAQAIGSDATSGG